MAKLKIACNHFQISAACFSFKLRYPEAFIRAANVIISIMSFNFMELSTPECSTGGLSYLERWSLKAFSPLMLMAPFVALAGISCLLTCGYCCGALRLRALSTLSVIASITFIWGIASAMEVWVCSKGAVSGDYRLDAAPEIECGWYRLMKPSNSTFRTLLSLSIILFVVYFGIQGGLISAVKNSGRQFKQSVFGGLKEGSEKWVVWVNFFKWLAVVASLFLASALLPRCFVISAHC
jgi:hypothetical protein